jgi:ATP-dependent RNA helicase DeaD
MLRNIEQHTRQKIRIEQVPSVLDLRARRLEKTQLTLRQAIESGKLDTYRSVVDSLAEEFDLLDVAAAALRLAHEAAGNREEDEREIAIVEPPRESHASPRKERKGSPGQQNGAGSKPRGPKNQKMVRIRIALGRKTGVRPADLVGAIANESGISGKDIGSIEMGNGFSLVEIPETAVDAVVEAMTGAKIRGQRVSVSRDRAFAGTPRKDRPRK